MQATEDLIGKIWGSTQALADDIGIARDTTRKWNKRIPQEHWSAVIAAAAKRGHKLTADDLLAASTPMKRRGLAPVIKSAPQRVDNRTPTVAGGLLCRNKV